MILLTIKENQVSREKVNETAMEIINWCNFGGKVCFQRFLRAMIARGAEMFVDLEAYEP